jgi:3'-phosphoadenosine 5'-phosphosulfate sulfotransferase (PAPS reductase)/FAD synthetase
VDAPFKVSEKCCYALKKQPFYSYENKTNRKPSIGIRAVDSNIRLQRYVSRGGCNAFTMKKESSWPLAFWNSEDIWDYLNKFNVPYSSIYSLGEEKTGCMWCMFGLQYDGNPNRFQRMKKTHPKIWNYCINKMGLKQVLDYIGSEYE